jgi:dCTP deaminase
LILSNQGIWDALAQGNLLIDPPPEKDQYTTSAVDLRLGSQFLAWDQSKFEQPGVSVHVDLSQHKFHSTAKGYLAPLRTETDGSVIFPPFREQPSHILATTLERVHLKLESLLAARVEGRSSLARLGLTIHLTAPTIHAGFDGHITLEMINFSPFHLRLVPAQTRVCQLILERLESGPVGDIRTEFQGQTSPAGGRA